jgi:MYXO-CTERM domain-containing protein
MIRPPRAGNVSDTLRIGCILAVWLWAPSTAANGRFPAAGQIAVNPTDANHIVVRTTYGLLTTRDAGQNWDWICEQAVKWTGQYDPAIAVTEDGSVLAGIYDHLGVSHGLTCAWTSAAGLDQKNVVDVSTERAAPSSSVALISNELGGGMFLTQLWASPDNAMSWSQAGIDLPSDFRGLTVDVAPSNPMCIYASGLHSNGTVGAIQRSLDRGATWELFDIPGSDANHHPFIGAIDPVNEQVLYVRLSGVPGRLLVSSDGGVMWQEVFAGAGSLKGFALSPDGATILAGGEADGVWRAPSSTLQFENASPVGVQCLTWAAAGVYACAGEFKDGFTVGLSTDQGSSFVPISHLSCVRGPLACDPATEVGQHCPAAWSLTAEVIDQASCLGDAGAGGGTPDAGVNPNPNTAGDPKGCGCRAAGSGGSAWEIGFLAVSAIALRRMRRRNSRGMRACFSVVVPFAVLNLHRRNLCAWFGWQGSRPSRCSG